MQSVTEVPVPRNEPVHGYAPGSPERKRLTEELAAQAASPVELTQTIGGASALGGGARVDVVQPHAIASVLGTFGTATHDDARAAVEALRDPDAEATLTCERALVAALGADCSTPVGAYATSGRGLRLRAFVGAVDGSTWITDELEGDEPAALGRAVAERLLAAGAEAVLRG